MEGIKVVENIKCAIGLLPVTILPNLLQKYNRRISEMIFLTLDVGLLDEYIQIVCLRKRKMDFYNTKIVEIKSA